MCDCIQRIEQLALLEKDKMEGLAYTELDSARIEQTAYIIDKTSVQRTKIYVPLMYRWRKIGSKGKVIQKKLETKIIATHCPFCGQPYEEVKHD